MKTEKKITSLVVDDERLARKALTTLLSELEQYEVIGEADTLPLAASLANSLKPQIIFLDIQLPGESGFDLLPMLNYKPHVVFVTAFDEFAVKAFEVNALDYLLKPVSPQRLEKVVSKLFEKEQPTTNPPRKLTTDDRLFLQFSAHYIFLKVDQIAVIASSGDYSVVTTKDGKQGLTNKTMQEWTERLPGGCFLRIHRSTIINLNFVAKVEEWFNNSFRVYMMGIAEPFIMSRRYATLIKANLG
ncbi:MAG: LytTR family DNA-binding domain-containing protein [Bacteroidales bacterium]|nr:LytTR family DNA-binding domain-containing protein [Bacteroidales bacterium]MDD3664528.1 LytTR family DNA-binding domain-containing protein [Bacteroidales bacterium]